MDWTVSTNFSRCSAQSEKIESKMEAGDLKCFIMVLKPIMVWKMRTHCFWKTLVNCLVLVYLKGQSHPTNVRGMFHWFELLRNSRQVNTNHSDIYKILKKSFASAHCWSINHIKIEWCNSKEFFFPLKLITTYECSINQSHFWW